jgi:aconitate hydratase
VGMGILPLEFSPGDTAASLGLTGEETFSIENLAAAIPTRKAVVKATRKDGTVQSFTTTVRIDTPQEREYYRHGGILQYVLRQLLKA